MLAKAITILDAAISKTATTICPMCEEPTEETVESEDGPICQTCAESGRYTECENCGKLINESRAETREVYPTTWVKERGYNPGHWEESESTTMCSECWAERDRKRPRRSRPQDREYEHD
jgi:methionyl-tRNA synthetase